MLAQHGHTPFPIPPPLRPPCCRRCRGQAGNCAAQELPSSNSVAAAAGACHPAAFVPHKAAARVWARRRRLPARPRAAAKRCAVGCGTAGDRASTGNRGASGGARGRRRCTPTARSWPCGSPCSAAAAAHCCAVGGSPAGDRAGAGDRCKAGCARPRRQRWRGWRRGRPAAVAVGPQLRGCSWTLPPCCIFDTLHQQQYKSCKQNQQPTIHTSCRLLLPMPPTTRTGPTSAGKVFSTAALPSLESLAADSARNELSTRGNSAYMRVSANSAYMRVSVRSRPPPSSAV